METLKGIKTDGASFNLAFVQSFELEKDFVIWGKNANIYSNVTESQRVTKLKEVYRIAKKMK